MLAKDPTTRPLAELLMPSLPLVALGAWLPDEKFFKAGSGNTQNHVLKMAEYVGKGQERFIVSHDATLRQLGSYRKFHAVLKDPGRLPKGWWDKAYRGDCPRGEHPADCAMGLATTLTDLMLLGDKQIGSKATKALGKRIALPEAVTTRVEQIGLYFFMMSHYVADAHMPCHTDARPLARYNGKLHMQWEEYVDKLVAEFPDPAKIPTLQGGVLLDRAAEAIPLDLPAMIPELKGDVWNEVISICRASFAVNCIVASPDKYPLVKTDHPRKDESDLPADAPMPSFQELFKGKDALRDELSQAILHDAVLGVAKTWKHVWQSVTKFSRNLHAELPDG
ncbi:MAG TPA: hypothetical protein VF516_33205 [Kofleriaceae bacterium]